MNSYVDNRFYRDGNFKKVSGVCAGIAKHYGWDRWVVRLAALIGFFTFPVVLAVAYVVATFLIPERV